MNGLLVLDKPAGWTSHDVVARVRRLAGTRRVGHAGTLDPMATGVLVLGVGQATRLLGHLTRHDKTYEATVRFGVTTTTDDAEGEVVSRCDTSGLTEAAIRDAAKHFAGPLAQVPPNVSAIQVGGVRAYAAARRGTALDLAAREVTVHALDVLAVRGDEADLRVTCSAGTYVRALARDLGAALGAGGHLTALRRTASGPYALPAPTLDTVSLPGDLTPLADAARAAFPSVTVDAETAARVAHGVRVPLDAAAPTALFAPDGMLLALATSDDGRARYLAVFN